MKERFLEIWYQHVQREGSEALLNWLCKSDFFAAPASTKYHGAYEGGLCEHSVNVFGRLVQLVNAVLPEDQRPSMETLAIVALLHDACKIGVYHQEQKWRKDERGKWESYYGYTFDDALPLGHGEKSLYIVSSFLKLSREEAMAIRWHMGPWQEGEARTAGAAFEKFPLSLFVHQADMLASYLDETRGA